MGECVDGEREGRVGDGKGGTYDFASVVSDGLLFFSTVRGEDVLVRSTEH